MDANSQLKAEFSLFLGKKEETQKVFYGSLFFIASAVLGTLLAWFFKASWEKMNGRLKIWQLAMRKPLPKATFSEALLLAMVLNLSVWSWLNNKDIFPIALGKMDEEIVVGAEDAVKIDDFQKESILETSSQKALGETRDVNLSLSQERCQKDKQEKKSSELCGKDEKDEALEKELKKIDDRARARAMAARKPVAIKISCIEKNDHPGKSGTKGKHTDEDCCPDPDEYPKAGCVYSPGGYALMLKR